VIATREANDLTFAIALGKHQFDAALGGVITQAGVEINQRLKRTRRRGVMLQ
jgi:hypothetical protein